MCSSALQPWKWQLTGIGYSTVAQASGAHCLHNGLWTRSYTAIRTTPQSATLGLHPLIHVPNYMDHYSFTLHGTKYRVAQIKIPHRTKRNFSTTVWDFYTQIFWFIWERSCYNSDYSDFFKIKNFIFLQSYGYINILRHMFNSARNNQQKLVIFIVKKHWLLLQIPESDK